MPNYQTGVLSASGGDVYTQLMAIVKTYVEARGWTSNLYEDYGLQYDGDIYMGKRLHIQKTIDTIDRFINLRSFKNQRIFMSTQYGLNTGIGMITSTAYDGATRSVTLSSVVDRGGGTIRFNTASPYIKSFVGATVTVSGTTNYNGGHTVTAVDSSTSKSWVEVTATFVSNQSGTIVGNSWWGDMAGATGLSDPNVVDGSGPAGGGALNLPVDVLIYFLFSENSGDNIYLICGNSTGYTGICFGTTSTGNFFTSCSTPRSTNPTTTPWYNNSLLTFSGLYGNLALRKKDDTGWYRWPIATATLDTSVIPALDATNTDLTNNSDSIVQQLLFCSPDNFKGNNPLIPAYIGIGVTPTGNVQKFAGVVPGIKYVNMKFMGSLTELTFSGDVYKLFRLYGIDDAEDATLGLAFLK